VEAAPTTPSALAAVASRLLIPERSLALLAGRGDMATIDDPGAYTRPWTVVWDAIWWTGGELDEYICQENNKHLQTLKDDFGKPIFRTLE
jgi:hypothetical protein